MNKNQIAENIVFLLSDEDTVITEPIFDLFVELVAAKFGPGSANYLRENTVMKYSYGNDGGPYFVIDEDPEQLDAFASEMRRAG